MKQLKKIYWTPFALCLIVLSLVALPVIAGSMSKDISEIPNCPYCGMDRHKFAHSRMYIEYDDETKLGTCSIHCASVDMAVNIDKAPKVSMVGDMKSKDLIDAGKAFWVLGGDKPGVMSKRAKWAFEKKADAESYISEHGGQLTDYEGVLQASFEDMYQDTKMIREKRKMKRMKMKKAE